jgi:hypothetical protein
MLRFFRDFHNTSNLGKEQRFSNARVVLAAMKIQITVFWDVMPCDTNVSEDHAAPMYSNVLRKGGILLHHYTAHQRRRPQIRKLFYTDKAKGAPVPKQQSRKAFKRRGCLRI